MMTDLRSSLSESNSGMVPLIGPRRLAVSFVSQFSVTFIWTYMDMCVAFVAE